MGSTKKSFTLFEDACRFWKIFDVACPLFKNSEKACKILQALQNDCSMEVFRKFFDALCKKFMHFLCNIQIFLQISVITRKILFLKTNQLKIYFGIFTKYSMQLGKFSMHDTHYSLLHAIKKRVVLIIYSFRGLFLSWLLKNSSPAIFYYNVKTWFSKEFLSKFSWVQWNVDENKWIELSKRQSSS